MRNPTGTRPAWAFARSALISTSLAGTLAFAQPAAAGDGAREINQTCALQTGCFTGDTPGYPVTLTSPGSYLLTSNLAITGENTHGLEVSASHVTIDLGGFAIEGPIACTGAPLTCIPSFGTGVGIRASAVTVQALSVHGGTITGMGSTGIQLPNYSSVADVRLVGNRQVGISTGTGATIRNTKGERNGGTGIACGTNGSIEDSSAIGNLSVGISCSTGASIRSAVARDNGSTGIVAGSNSIVSQSAASGNTGNGISVGAGSLVQECHAVSNSNFGLSLSTVATGYRANVVASNGMGTIGSGTNLGHNLCNGLICP